MVSGSVIPFSFVWEGFLHSVTCPWPSSMFCFLLQMTQLVLPGMVERWVISSHTNTMGTELIIIYRENPFSENFIKMTNEPNLHVLAPGKSHGGAWVTGGGGLFHSTLSFPLGLWGFLWIRIKKTVWVTITNSIACYPEEAARVPGIFLGMPS